MRATKSASLTAFKVLGILALSMAIIFGLAACGGPVSLWKADLSQDGVFNVDSGKAEQPYGTVTKNEDGTVTLKSSTANVTGEKWAANTYFGEKDKNFDYTNGMDISYKVKVDPATMTEGTHAVWSLALNGKNGAYLTELPTYFLGTEEGVKFVYQFAGVDARDTVMANESAYTITEAGEYTVTYTLTTAENGELNVTVTLKDAANKTLYTSEASTFTVIENDDYTAGTVVKEDMTNGIRYLWLSRADVDVVVSGIEITE